MNNAHLLGWTLLTLGIALALWRVGVWLVRKDHRYT